MTFSINFGIGSGPLTRDSVRASGPASLSPSLTRRALRRDSLLTSPGPGPAPKSPSPGRHKSAWAGFSGSGSGWQVRVISHGPDPVGPGESLHPGANLKLHWNVDPWHCTECTQALAAAANLKFVDSSANGFARPGRGPSGSLTPGNSDTPGARQGCLATRNRAAGAAAPRKRHPAGGDSDS